MSQLQTFGDITKEIATRLSVSTTAAYYTDDIIKTFALAGYKRAVGYKKWPFTQGKETTTFTGSEEYSYPEAWKSNSIRLLQVGGKRLQKKNFEDYQIFREEEPSSGELIFANYGRRYFINPNINTSGTIVVWGQYVPALDASLPAATTPFTESEEAGNDAIVEIALSYAMTREKKESESILHLKKAQAILDEIWTNIKDEQFDNQSTNRGMFKRFDVLHGALEDELIKRDQFF